ncbi:efflux RND transporter periplasmic adaptor subunit [Pseudonocardia aurantiaca]|uniref:Biotin/lipoyl-binding protein n=1 Tax=Pseudonocardia aurantiaca TaxID=75290 RepID=A0ABW4FRB5_9PSEU
MLTLPVVMLLAACTVEEPALLTVQVTRTSVTSTVTATGSLRAISEQKLGLVDAGKLVELNVTVGQQVEPGQVLARIDDFDAFQELESAIGQLAGEQAALARAREGHHVDAVADDVEHARRVLRATEERAEAIDKANASAVHEAERRLGLDEEILEEAKAGADHCDDDTSRGAGREGEAGAGDWGVVVPASARCERTDESDPEVQAAERQVRASKAALAQAGEKERVDHTQHELAIANARRDLGAAENEAEAVRGERPRIIDERAAVVGQMQAEVDRAQRARDETVLRSPVGGKVATINGVVGELIGAGSGTTALAPGGTVPLPDTNTGVSSAESGGGAGGGPGGSAFIVLDNVNTFQMVAPFAEADAARLELHQQVEVTFDAVPDLVRVGTVISIAPTGRDIQGVMSYDATIVLDELDPRLEDGQTAAVQVVVDKRDDVLVVPNAALLQSGQTGVVTVVDRDGAHRQVQVELGLAGDSVTQVISGLEKGQEVVVAQPE